MSNLPAQGEGFRKTPQELAAYNAACPMSGSYYARIFKVMRVGTSEQTFFKTNEKKDVDQIKISFELITHPSFIFDPAKGPQPWTCHKTDKRSTESSSNMYRWIKQIFRGDAEILRKVAAGDFSLSHLLNKLVMIDIEQKISKSDAKNPNQANITVKNISAPLILAGIPLATYEAQKLYNELVVFDTIDFIAGVPAEREAFKKLNGWEQKLVFESNEIKASRLRLDDFKTEKSTAPQQSYNVGAQAPSQDYRSAPVADSEFDEPDADNVF